MPRKTLPRIASVAASRTEIACRLQNGGLAFVGIRQVTGIRNQLSRSANRTFHLQISLP
jgi:hypothetical protein